MELHVNGGRYSLNGTTDELRAFVNRASDMLAQIEAHETAVRAELATRNDKRDGHLSLATFDLGIDEVSTHIDVSEPKEATHG